MEGKMRADVAWWILGSRRIALESLDMDISLSQEGQMQVHATAILKGRVSGVSPGDQDLEIELEMEGVNYRIQNAVVFDMEFLSSNKSSLQITGTLQPARL